VVTVVLEVAFERGGWAKTKLPSARKSAPVEVEFAAGARRLGGSRGEVGQCATIAARGPDFIAPVALGGEENGGAGGVRGRECDPQRRATRRSCV